eukprot:m.32339 g.32339  ORF g.32339 m.32339 type:complete len:128 (-) comp10780_c0_seq1:273-656(-)
MCQLPLSSHSFFFVSLVCAQPFLFCMQVPVIGLAKTSLFPLEHNPRAPPTVLMVYCSLFCFLVFGFCFLPGDAWTLYLKEKVHLITKKNVLFFVLGSSMFVTSTFSALVVIVWKTKKGSAACCIYAG